jgi:hypothetical protein
MTKGAMAALSAGVAVFGFDPEPGTPASRALHVLTVKRTLPTGDLGPKERFPEGSERYRLVLRGCALRAGPRPGCVVADWPRPAPRRSRRRGATRRS